MNTLFLHPLNASSFPLSPSTLFKPTIGGDPEPAQHIFSLESQAIALKTLSYSHNFLTVHTVNMTNGEMECETVMSPKEIERELLTALGERSLFPTYAPFALLYTAIFVSGLIGNLVSCLVCF